MRRFLFALLLAFPSLYFFPSSFSLSASISASLSLLSPPPSASEKERMSTNPTTDLQVLQAITVRGPIDLSNHETASSLPEQTLGQTYENFDAVLFIIRRVGCPWCRTTSLLLSSLRPQFDQHRIKLIGVTFQTGQELKLFVEGGYLKGDLFLDEQQKAYEKVGKLYSYWKYFTMYFTDFSAAFKARVGKITGNTNEVQPVFSTLLGIKDGKIVFEQKNVEDPNIPLLLKQMKIDGDDYKAALESVELNLKAAGDDLVGPACTISSRTCG